MTDAPKPLTKPQRKALDRLKRKQEAALRAAKFARVAAEAEERRAEAVAPAIQRKDAIDPTGVVLRRARLEPDGLAFKVSNPIRNMVARGDARGENGNMPLIRPVHEKAADRLYIAWEEGGRGVGMGSSNFGERTSGGATPGVLADAVVIAIMAQSRKREEFEKARAYLGSSWPVIDAVVLQRIDLRAWASERRVDRNAAVGLLAAALERLVEFYRPPAQPEQPAIIRAVSVGALEPQNNC